MAVGFTESAATEILTSKIKSTTYVALSTTTPTKTGGNFTEPAASAGYARAKFGDVNTTISAQVTNNDYIFIFEALASCGTITHVGLSTNENRGGAVFLMGELTTPITVGIGYVPLIRPKKFIVGLDKEALESYV